MMSPVKKNPVKKRAVKKLRGFKPAPTVSWKGFEDSELSAIEWADKQRDKLSSSLLMFVVSSDYNDQAPSGWKNILRSSASRQRMLGFIDGISEFDKHVPDRIKEDIACLRDVLNAIESIEEDNETKYYKKRYSRSFLQKIKEDGPTSMTFEETIWTGLIIIILFHYFKDSFLS